MSSSLSLISDEVQNAFQNAHSSASAEKKVDSEDSGLWSYLFSDAWNKLTQTKAEDYEGLILDAEYNKPDIGELILFLKKAFPYREKIKHFAIKHLCITRDDLKNLLDFLRQSPQLKSLMFYELSISGTDDEIAFLETLTSFLKEKPLEKFSFDDNDDGGTSDSPEKTKLLFQAILQSKALRFLRLNILSNPYHYLEFLPKFLDNLPSLETLDIRGFFDEASMNYFLSQCKQHPKLNKIKILTHYRTDLDSSHHGNLFGKSSKNSPRRITLSLLSSVMFNPKLEELSYRGNYPADPDSPVFYLREKDLKRIHLYCNIAQNASVHYQLKQLQLTEVRLNYVTSKALCLLIPLLTELEYLSLNDSVVHLCSLKNILLSLNSNSKLRRLGLSLNTFSSLADPTEVVPTATSEVNAPDASTGPSNKSKTETYMVKNPLKIFDRWTPTEKPRRFKRLDALLSHFIRQNPHLEILQLRLDFIFLPNIFLAMQNHPSIHTLYFDTSGLCQEDTFKISKTTTQHILSLVKINPKLRNIEFFDHDEPLPKYHFRQNFFASWWKHYFRQVAFCMGFHRRLGQDSSVTSSLKSPIFDRSVIKLLWSYLEEPEFAERTFKDGHKKPLILSKKRPIENTLSLSLSPSVSLPSASSSSSPSLEHIENDLDESSDDEGIEHAPKRQRLSLLS